MFSFRPTEATEIYGGAGSLNITGQTALELTAGYNYSFLFEWLEFGGNITYNTQSYNDVSASAFTIIFGPTLSFGAHSEAIFATLGGALRSGSSSPDTNPEASSSTTTSADGTSTTVEPGGFGLAVFVGKRFPLGEISWRPSIGVAMIGELGIIFNPIQFSLASK